MPIQLHLKVRRWHMVHPVTCQLTFESAWPFPNCFKGQLLRWFCVVNHLVCQVRIVTVKNRISFVSFMSSFSSSVSSSFSSSLWLFWSFCLAFALFSHLIRQQTLTFFHSYPPWHHHLKGITLKWRSVCEKHWRWPQQNWSSRCVEKKYQQKKKQQQKNRERDSIYPMKYSHAGAYRLHMTEQLWWCRPLARESRSTSRFVTAPRFCSCCSSDATPPPHRCLSGHGVPLER